MEDLLKRIDKWHIDRIRRNYSTSQEPIVLQGFFAEVPKEEIYSGFKPKDARRILLKLNHIITRDYQLVESLDYFSNRFPTFKICYEILVPNRIEHLAEKSSLPPSSENFVSQGEIFMRIINSYEQFVLFTEGVNEINAGDNIENIKDKEIDRALLETLGGYKCLVEIRQSIMEMNKTAIGMGQLFAGKRGPHVLPEDHLFNWYKNCIIPAIYSIVFRDLV